MTPVFRLDRAANALFDARGRTLDLALRRWQPGEPATGETIDAVAAATWLQRDSGMPCRVPVGVIGPRVASAAQLGAAEAVGHRLAAMGFAIVCGGREGVMAAVARGARGASGIVIGLLPDADPSLANPDITVAIATGIGEARNALIARASLCLVAIGDSHGTLSEVALGRHFGKRVIGLEGAAAVDGVLHVQDAAQAMFLVAELAVGYPGQDD